MIANRFLEELERISSDCRLGDDLAKARRTLEVMGNLLISPVASELRSKGRLELIAPIVRLFIALRKLEEGQTNAILEPKKLPGRPRGTGAAPNVIGAAAAALTALVKSGQRKEPAARKVALWLHGAGHRLPGGKPVEGQTVINWYKKISASALGTLHSPHPGIIDLTGLKPKKDTAELRVYRLAMSRYDHWLFHELSGGKELNKIERPSGEKLARTVLEKGLACPSEPYFLWGLGQADDWNLIDPF